MARLTRDTLIITVGLVGLYNETFIETTPREQLVWLYGGMVLGIPFLRQGDKSVDQEEKKKEIKENST
jgi:hypothetical protein